ncbi:beta-lactamase [Dyadobacter frigoris]|jgi:metallo-beta-lactamase class B|uniref:subclass B1 metallo-beta-lactamase n=1 Tax=Dyadobacter frigoris TaxID=2576211 RepID=UPI0024A038BB|nr:subclass B1 metallo-beta-lactamase [Dyadobacter frigoris]GLU56402.1 beta-lactamase [Dyadobacter frigoris]
MKFTITTTFIIFLFLTSFSAISQKRDAFKPKELYRSKELIITQITKNTFEHISFKQTNDFGNVPCNGLIVRDKNETIIFDTPINDKISEELIKWIKETLHCKINAVVPTHFHDDSAGGLKAFDDHGIPSYAYFKTIELTKENNFVVPKNSFADSLVLKVGDQQTITKFFGEGHTRDNVVGYFPAEDILFGGCLIRAANAGKGYVDDANVADWSGTVEKVKKRYPNVKIVVPGHGDYGNTELLDHTINLYKVQ